MFPKGLMAYAGTMKKKDVVSNDQSRRAGTFVLPATPLFAVVAQNKLAGDDSDFNGTPAIVGHQLFLRSNRFLYCIEAGAGG